MSINSKEISIVVQGAIDNIETPKCIKSIRKHLPGAEIILSTWEGEDVSELDYDLLVINIDPGAFIYTTGRPVYNNLNRQLLSTQEGLKKATRKYVLKFRTDLILTNSKFLKYFDKYQERCDEYKLFERKVIISALYSRRFILKGSDEIKWDIPFHPSDFFLFGLNEDLKKYFLDTPLVSEPEYSNYFKDKPEIEKPFDVTLYQYPPEQYFAYSCFKRYFNDLTMNSMTDINENIIKQSEIAMVNNFIILEYKQHGIYLNKYDFSKQESNLDEKEYPGLYLNLTYLDDYKKYCARGFKIPLCCCWKRTLGIDNKLLNLNKHIKRFISPRSVMALFSELISIIVYSTAVCLSIICNSYRLFWRKDNN